MSNPLNPNQRKAKTPFINISINGTFSNTIPSVFQEVSVPNQEENTPPPKSAAETIQEDTLKRTQNVMKISMNDTVEAQVRPKEGFHFIVDFEEQQKDTQNPQITDNLPYTKVSKLVLGTLKQIQEKLPDPVVDNETEKTKTDIAAEKAKIKDQQTLEILGLSHAAYDMANRHYDVNLSRFGQACFTYLNKELKTAERTQDRRKINQLLAETGLDVTKQHTKKTVIGAKPMGLWEFAGNFLHNRLDPWAETCDRLLNSAAKPE